MTRKQQTIAQAVELEGVGLFAGKPVRLRCLPAPEGAGIAFIRVDLPGKPEVKAAIEFVPSGQGLRWTALRRENVEIRMVEHFLSATHGLGIDNLRVEITNDEMPVADGSAKSFADLFLDAGIIQQSLPAPIRVIDRPRYVTHDDLTIVALPQAEGLTITYILDYGEDYLKSQTFTIALTPETYLSDIAPARTFLLRPEVDIFLQRGLGKGATPENTLVIEPDGGVETALRFPNECVRHKILDIIGDLAFARHGGQAGGPLQGRIIGYKSGHSANVELARKICGESVVRLARHPEPVEGSKGRRVEPEEV